VLVCASFVYCFWGFVAHVFRLYVERGYFGLKVSG